MIKSTELEHRGVIFLHIWMLMEHFFLCIPRLHSEKGVRFIYGKWTEFIKCTDYESYEEYLRENTHKFRRSERSKSPNESPAHTPRKVLSKLNSLKMASFRSLSIQDVCIAIAECFLPLECQN